MGFSGPSSWACASVEGLEYLKSRAEAIRKLKQGIGRGIRSKSDSCVLWILDPRFPISKELEAVGLAVQGPAMQHQALVTAIPLRFRSGLRDVYRKAEIFRVSAQEATGSESSAAIA